MNWNHVWELFKINLLYANPQAVTNLQKRQEKKKKANFSIVNAMLRPVSYTHLDVYKRQVPCIFTCRTHSLTWLSLVWIS